jgi:hypothetical protein
MSDKETSTMQDAVILRDSQSNELVIVPHNDKLGIRVVRGAEELSFFLTHDQITVLINKLETYRLNIQCCKPATVPPVPAPAKE